MAQIPAWLDEVLRASSRVRLAASTVWAPDAGPPTAARPLDFVLHVEGGALTYYSAHSRLFRPIDATARDRLLTLVAAAVQTAGTSVGVDTALGRHYTHLVLDWDDARGDRSSSRWSFNHLHSYHGAEAPSWTSLLQYLSVTLFDELADPDLRRWLFLLDRFVPDPPFAGTFEAGGVARCADDGLLRLPLGRGIYLRVAQPPTPSCLLLLRPAPPWGIEVALRQTPQGESVERVVARIALPDLPPGIAADEKPLPRWASRDATDWALAPLRTTEEARAILEFVFPSRDEVLMRTRAPSPGVFVQRAV